jgi:hypothetical protein
MADPSADDLLLANPLEALKANLRSISKLRKRYRNGYLAYVASSLEEYVYGELCLAVEYAPIGAMASDYIFLIHRIPAAKAGLSIEKHRIANSSGLEGSTNFKADSMFIVRHVGDFSDQVFGAKRPWRSRVWLLRKNYFEQRDRERGPCCGLPLAKDFLQSDYAFGPGVSSIKPGLTMRGGGNMQRPVESMLKIKDRISEKMPNARGQGLKHLEFMNALAGFRIHLNHKGKGVILEICVELMESAIYARPCPVDILLDRIEAGRASQHQVLI